MCRWLLPLLLLAAAAAPRPAAVLDRLAARLALYRVLWPHAIDDVLASFSAPLVLEIDCPASALPPKAGDLAGGKRTLPAQTVQIVVRTRPVPWTGGRHGEDGNYLWNFRQSYDSRGNRLPVRADNALSLRPAALTKEGVPEEIEHVVLMYHELLHGQLLIDAIRGDERWRAAFCDFSDGADDPRLLAYSDSRHARIPALEEEFRQILRQVALGRAGDGQDPWSPLPAD